MISVTKRFKFEASHYLENPELSVKANIEEFGACSGFRSLKQAKKSPRKYHGHSYKMEITVKGEIDSRTGFLINFVNLKKIVNNLVVNKLDHECLNNIMPSEYWPCTVENMLMFILNTLPLIEDIAEATQLRGFLHSIKIWETEDSFAEWVRVGPERE